MKVGVKPGLGPSVDTQLAGCLWTGQGSAHRPHLHRDSLSQSTSTVGRVSRTQCWVEAGRKQTCSRNELHEEAPQSRATSGCDMAVETGAVMERLAREMGPHGGTRGTGWARPGWGLQALAGGPLLPVCSFIWSDWWCFSTSELREGWRVRAACPGKVTGEVTDTRADLLSPR